MGIFDDAEANVNREHEQKRQEQTKREESLATYLSAVNRYATEFAEAARRRGLPTTEVKNTPEGKEGWLVRLHDQDIDHPLFTRIMVLTNGSWVDVEEGPVRSFTGKYKGSTWFAVEKQHLYLWTAEHVEESFKHAFEERLRD